MLRFNQENLMDTLTKEWIVTNGIGGYASSTISGANSRRYHGLLIASLNPPVQREVFVSKIDESIILQDDSTIALHTGMFTGAIHPEGFNHIKSFERNPLPKVTFSVREFSVTKTIFMVNGSNTTVAEYKNSSAVPIVLSLTPSFVHRDYHSLFHGSPEFDYYFEPNDKFLKIHSSYGSIPLYIGFSKGEFIEERTWFRNYEYNEETKRGQDNLEDAYRIGNIIVRLEPDEKIHIILSIEPEMIHQDPVKLKENEISRIHSLKPEALDDDFLVDLIVAADQFLVKRKSTGSFTVIAGYHWFTDWGRDTMIALQGLTIETGRKEICRSVLETFFHSIDKGMLPNRFPDYKNDNPQYNTIDATLWLFDTLYKYHRKFNDKHFIKENLHHLEEIIVNHITGTRYNIHLTEEGFIYGGEGLSQLTWMDARIGDHVITPRHGCPVEIQALWYNALRVYLYFCVHLKVKTSPVKEKVKELAKLISKNFPLYFYNVNGYLNDVVISNSEKDPSIRPNQIYALSLSFPIIDRNKGKSVLAAVDKYLYTPYGLRTLAPDHPDFVAVYEGNPLKRDSSYHQGTTWTFLLSDYFDAFHYVYGNSPEFAGKIKECISIMQKHFYESGCINGIAEIFDGLEPSEGKGTVHQAWSISALIKILNYSHLLKKEN
jgi:predicted glycogen debranching enzyme